MHSSRFCSIFYFAITLLLVAVVQPSLGAHRPDDIPESVWIDVTDSLLSIHATIQAGKIEEASEALQTAASFWIEPFDSIAQQSLERIQEDPTAEAPGVLELLEKIYRLDNRPLRESLEAKILSANPPINTAIESIRLTRANAVFFGGDFESALAAYRLLRQDFPDSESMGIYQFNIALVLRNLEQFQQAIPEFEQLFHLAVNNKEAEGSSIMEMGFRNYHHRAAVNISLCYEELGDFDAASKWIELASTEYTYEGWCGVEIDGAQRYIEKTQDRIAFAQGPKNGVARILVVAQRAWPAWALWVSWCTLGLIGAQTSRNFLEKVVYGAIPLSWAVSALLIVIGLRDHWRLTDWILPGHYPESVAIAAAIFTVGSICSLVLRKMHKRTIAKRTLSLTCLATSVYLLLGLVQIGVLPLDLARYSLHDIQVAAFSYFTLPAALLVSGATLLFQNGRASRSG